MKWTFWASVCKDWLPKAQETTEAKWKTGKRREARAPLLWITPDSVDSEYSAHGRPRDRSRCGGQRALTRSILNEWASQCGPQPSSIKLAQELVRDDNSWAPPQTYWIRNWGTPLAIWVLLNPKCDSDANSSLRTTNPIRPDPIFPVGWSPVAQGLPAIANAAHQGRFRRAGVTTYQHSTWAGCLRDIL